MVMNDDILSGKPTKYAREFVTVAAEMGENLRERT
jgi:hypothetical protein